MPDPYAPCPCGSGEKYKFCCKAKGDFKEESPEREHGVEVPEARDGGPSVNPFTVYIQPLLENTDGSAEEVEHAAHFGLTCWNLALMNEVEAERAFAELRTSLKIGEEEFREFRRNVVESMIRRHREMFPEMDPALRQMVRNAGPDVRP